MVCNLSTFSYTSMSLDYTEMMAVTFLYASWGACMVFHKFHRPLPQKPAIISNQFVYTRLLIRTIFSHNRMSADWLFFSLSLLYVYIPQDKYANRQLSQRLITLITFITKGCRLTKSRSTRKVNQFYVVWKEDDKCRFFSLFVYAELFAALFCVASTDSSVLFRSFCRFWIGFCVL